MFSIPDCSHIEKNMIIYAFEFRFYFDSFLMQYKVSFIFIIIFSYFDMDLFKS